MVRALLFCLVCLVSAPTTVLAQQEPPQEMKSNIPEFESADGMVDWFESLNDSESSSRYLSKNPDGDVTSIALFAPTATDKNIGLLSDLRSLRHLRIKCANRMSTEGFDELSKLHGLEHLEIGLVYGKLPVNFWQTLAALPRLKKVDLKYLELNEGEMAGIEKLSVLESISFQNIKGMTQMSCEQMSVLDGLRILKLSRTTLRPSDLSPLNRISSKCKILVEFNRNAR